MRDFDLEDVEEVARCHPESFFIPSLEERTSQREGDSVRLHFVLRSPPTAGPRAERMWVIVTDTPGPGGQFRGTLQNQPALLRSIRAGDTIEFEARHIARVQVRREDSRWVECAEKSALVSVRILESGGAASFAYRESADREEDSGWRLFAGGESDEYANDPKNIRLCYVGWLCDRDPSLVPLFQQAGPGAWERAGANSPWVAVEDWQPLDGT